MKIVALDGHVLDPSKKLWSIIEPLGEFELYERTSPEETISRCSGAEIVLTNKVVMDSDVISALPDLKFIGVTATGYNVVDTTFARSRNIPVSNVPEYSTQSVAQHVFAGLLSFIHRPEQHHASVVEGKWTQSEDFAYWLKPISELAGKTFGVVGLGKIGRATAKLASAFGLNVIASSRRHVEPLDVPGFKWLSVEELFEEADIISLHCPQTSETEGMVNKDLLSRMQPHSILINTARGGLIVESDLASTLNAGKIGGAVLDVASVEPIAADNPLLSANNCLITPHNAWTTIEARTRLVETVAEYIKAFQAGKPINLVN